MAGNVVVLVVALCLATLAQGRATMKNETEYDIDEPSELNDESMHVRMYKDAGKPETIMEINAKSGTDEAITKYCEIHDCVEQGGDEILTKEQKKIEEKDKEIATHARPAAYHYENHPSSKEERAKELQRASELRSRDHRLLPPVRYWKSKGPHGRIVIPYRFSIDIEYSTPALNAIKAAMKYLKEKSCIDWVPVEETSNPHQYHVEFIQGSGCYSYVGDARLFMKGIHKQPISIGRGCEHVGTVLHEMLHCLGFFHEQARSDRDRYVQIYLENLDDKKKAHNFDIQYSYQSAIPYDLRSIMHYGPTAFAKPGTYTILRRGCYRRGKERSNCLFKKNLSGLSHFDLLELNRRYQCPWEPRAPPVPQTTLPPKLDSTCQLLATLGSCVYRKVCTMCAAECSKVPSRQRGALNFNAQSPGAKSSKECKFWVNKGYCEPTHKYYLHMQIYCLKSCTSRNFPADGGCGQTATQNAQVDSTCQLLATLGSCVYRKVCTMCAAECAKVPSRQRGALNFNSKSSKECKLWVNKGYCEPTHKYYLHMQIYCLKSCTSRNFPADGGCGQTAN